MIDLLYVDQLLYFLIRGGNALKRDTRQEMIMATAFLLQKNGYAGTGMNDIIQHSGAPKGSIYYHFPNGKEQLAVEAVEWTRENVTAFIREHLSRYDDAVESIQKFVLDSAARFEENNYFQGVPISAMVLETAFTSEKLREACRGVLDAWSEEFADKLLANGYSQTEAQDLGDMINLMVQGAFVISLSRQNASALSTVAMRIPQLLKY